MMQTTSHYFNMQSKMIYDSINYFVLNIFIDKNVSILLLMSFKSLQLKKSHVATWLKTTLLVERRCQPLWSLRNLYAFFILFWKREWNKIEILFVIILVEKESSHWVNNCPEVKNTLFSIKCFKMSFCEHVLYKY